MRLNAERIRLFVIGPWATTLSVIALAHAEKLAPIRDLALPFTIVAQSLLAVAGFFVPQAGIAAILYATRAKSYTELQTEYPGRFDIVIWFSISYHFIVSVAAIYGIGLYGFDQNPDGGALLRNAAIVVIIAGSCSLLLSPYALLLTNSDSRRSIVLAATAGLSVFTLLTLFLFLRFEIDDGILFAAVSADACILILSLIVVYKSAHLLSLQIHDLDKDMLEIQQSKVANNLLAPIPSRSHNSSSEVTNSLPPTTSMRTSAEAVSNPEIFLSYRRKDSQAMTDRIFDHLTSRLSRESVLRDIDSIPRGADFRRWLTHAVQNCDVLLAIIGPNWLNSVNAVGERRLDDPTDSVRIEIETALTNNIPIIPVLLPEASMPSPEDLPESLRELSSRNASFVRHDPDFASDMGRLVADTFSIANAGR